MAELAPDDFAIAQEILEDNAALLADETKLMIILT
jgi:hypothetical protein